MSERDIMAGESLRDDQNPLGGSRSAAVPSRCDVGNRGVDPVGSLGTECCRELFGKLFAAVDHQEVARFGECASGLRRLQRRDDGAGTTSMS